MSRYWLGIGAGAIAVFGVGMTGIALGKKGLHELKTTVIGSATESLQNPIGALRFRLDGHRIGKLRSLSVNSNGSWGEKSVRMVVGLDDRISTDALRECGIAGDRFRGPGDDAEFTCVPMSEADAHGLVQIGEVQFEPGELTRPLLVSARDRRDLQLSDVNQLEANLESPDGRSVSGSATFDVSSRRGDRQRGVLTLKAGDGRALIDIRDEQGNAVFHLDAGDHGVSLNATDRKGQELLRLLAGSAGIDLKIDK